MSVLIRGMEMPISCWRCPFCLTVDPDTYRCIPTGQEFESTFDAIDHIVVPCPLVPVLPHGRLIDADELIKDECNHCDGECEIVDCDCLGCKNNCRCDFIKGVLEMPTIVEAEGE